MPLPNVRDCRVYELVSRVLPENHFSYKFDLFLFLFYHKTFFFIFASSFLAYFCMPASPHPSMGYGTIFTNHDKATVLVEWLRH